MARLQTRNRNNTNGHEHRNRMKKQQQQQPEPTNKRHIGVLKSARAFELPFSSILLSILSHCCLYECAERYINTHTHTERTWDRIVCPRAHAPNSIRPSPFPIRISERKKNTQFLLPSTLSCSIAH